ncbi:MAG: hypothetical protein V3W50_05650 [Thermoanaerobaculia bacterium]
MTTKRRAGLVRAAVVALVAGSVAGAVYAAGYETIFHGRLSEGRIWAIRLDPGTDFSALDNIEPEAGTTLIIYQNDLDVSSAEPMAIRVSGGTQIRFEDPQISRDGTLVSDYIKAANVAGGKKLEAICVDGSHPRISGGFQLSRLMKAWENCRRGHGGVERIFYRRYKDTNAIVASICEDFRLVAGDGAQCGGRSGVLVRIRNREY